MRSDSTWQRIKHRSSSWHERSQWWSRYALWHNANVHYFNNDFIFSPSLPPSFLLSSLLPETTDHLGIEFMGKEALLVLHLHESHQHMASYWINIVLCNCLINPGTFQAERNEHTRTPAYLYEVMKRWSESVLSNDETPLSASSVRPLLVSLSY